MTTIGFWIAWRCADIQELCAAPGVFSSRYGSVPNDIGQIIGEPDCVETLGVFVESFLENAATDPAAGMEFLTTRRASQEVDGRRLERRHQCDEGTRGDQHIVRPMAVRRPHAVIGK